MARIDKYDPIAGGHRAPLGFDIPTADVGKVFAVGFDANGRAVKSIGQTGYKGVVCASSPMLTGEPVDVMQHGEIVDVTGFNAGQNIYTGAAGAITATVGTVPVGHTIEAWRLIVRFSPVVGNGV